MGKTTGIEWTDSTWNPIRGCSRVSEGCRNCYAEAVAARFSGPGQAYAGLATFKVIDAGKDSERTEPRWTGDVRLIDKALHLPLSWKEPRKIFVNSMSDLFHPGVKGEWLADIFDLMARARQHTYQILTKRPERMLEALEAASAPQVAQSFLQAYGQAWPPPNWWFGVSIEDQETANHRLPILARCKAAVRFVSYEPALGPVDLFEALRGDFSVASIDWMIVGGESGPRARPMHPQWARDVKNTCETIGIPFFFKQWGEWLPYDQITDLAKDCMKESVRNDLEACAYRVGKHTSGALLDGVESKEFPNVERVAVA